MASRGFTTALSAARVRRAIAARTRARALASRAARDARTVRDAVREAAAHRRAGAVEVVAPPRDELKYPNWFVQYAQAYFERHLSPNAGRDGLRFLQIGAYTGDATVWLLEHILTGRDSRLTDVDTWRGSDEEGHEQMNFDEVERLYDARTASARASGRVEKFRGSSKSFFDSRSPGAYDFVYIDGDHTAFGVLNDAVRAYPLLRVGGIIAFDDYQWQSGKGRLHDPAPAIDAVSDLYANRLELLEGGRQMWFRKTGAAEDLAHDAPRPRSPKRITWRSGLVRR